jgi:hypothetical protein
MNHTPFVANANINGNDDEDGGVVGIGGDEEPGQLNPPGQPCEPDEPKAPSTSPEIQVKQKSNSDDEQHSSKKNMKTSILSFLLC